MVERFGQRNTRGDRFRQACLGKDHNPKETQSFSHVSLELKEDAQGRCSGQLGTSHSSKKVGWALGSGEGGRDSLGDSSNRARRLPS